MEGSYTSMSKGEALVGGLLRIQPVWRDVADTMSCRMDVGKVCYLCRGLQNYSNSRVLGYGQLGGPALTLCKFLKDFEF